jgi:hypothetical protein
VASLLSELQSAGFDFATPLEALAQSHPPVPNWGYEGHQVLVFNLPQPWAGLGASWKVAFPNSWERLLPPREYHGEFAPYPDAKQNFLWAQRLLRARLGPGQPGIASNTYAEEWTIDSLQVRLTVWPRERNLGTTNVYAKLNPHLWTAANVVVHVPWGGTTPAPRTAPTGERLLTELNPSTRGLYAHRVIHQPNLAELWYDTTTVHLALPDYEIRFPAQEVTALVHAIATPARGGGWQEVNLRLRAANRFDYSINLQSAPYANNLAPTATRLANAFQVPLLREEFPDE